MLKLLPSCATDQMMEMMYIELYTKTQQ